MGSPCETPPAVGTGSDPGARPLPREPPAGEQCVLARALSDATRGLGYPSLAPSPTTPYSPLCLGSRVSKCLNREVPLDLCSFLSSRWMARAPGGGLGPQGAGRTPVDGASWPALSSALAPAPRACPPSSAFWGEEQALGGLTALGGSPRVPVATQPGGTCGREPRLPIKEPGTTPASAAAQRSPGSSAGRLRAPRCCQARGRPSQQPPALPGPAPLPARSPGSPSAVPRDLSYTGPGGCGHVPASPSKRSPLSAKPGRAGGRDETPAGD